MDHKRGVNGIVQMVLLAVLIVIIATIVAALL